MGRAQSRRSRHAACGEVAMTTPSVGFIAMCCSPRRTPLLICAFSARDCRGYWLRPSPPKLAFTRYSFTIRLLCTNQSSMHCLPPLALPMIVHLYCTSIAQYTTPHDPPLAYAIHYTIYNIGNAISS